MKVSPFVLHSNESIKQAKHAQKPKVQKKLYSDQDENPKSPAMPSAEEVGRPLNEGAEDSANESEEERLSQEMG